VLSQSGYIQTGLQWSQTYSGVITPTPWQGRYGHSIAMTANSALLIIGGLTNSSMNNFTGSATNTVQRSINEGLTWQPTITGTFSPRFFHSSTLTSAGTVLLIGGFSLSQSNPASPPGVLVDTWYSKDGEVWSAGSQMPWSRGRGGHSVTTDSTSTLLYVTGGLTMPYQCLNDVWKTPDGGLTWQIATINAPFTPRAFHGSVVRLGTLFILGGANIAAASMTWTGLNDVWTSVDQGSTWNQLPEPLPYLPMRILSAIICYNNDDIYLIGGVNIPKKFTLSNPFSLLMGNQTTTQTVFNDVYTSSDAGLSWIQTNPTSVFNARFGLGVAVLGQDLTIIGGVNQQGDYMNDVWMTILPKDSSGSDGTILAAIIGSLSGIFLIFIILLRRFQTRFSQIQVSGKTEKELLKAAQV